MNGNSVIANYSYDNVDLHGSSNELEDNDDTVTPKELVIKFEGTMNRIKVQSTDTGLKVCGLIASVIAI